MPEIELPDGFRVIELANWVERIPAKRMRTLVRSTLASWGIPTEAQAGESVSDVPGGPSNKRQTRLSRGVEVAGEGKG